MDDKAGFKSSLSEEISGFISEKRSLGFKYSGEEAIMVRFDKYWLSHGFGKTGFSSDNLSGWLAMLDTEGPGSLVERISVVRQFSIYLNGIGIPSYIPPINVKYERPLPHIFSEAELSELFTIIDSYSCMSNHAFSKIMANEYPVLFRLIYLNGLRISEACRLSMAEVDLENGILTIRNGKGKKDRLVYLADDMCQLCREYILYMEAEIGSPSKWLFPGRNPETPIAIPTVETKFNDFLAKTSFASTCSTKPRVHDLRHTFVVDRINSWSEQGLDFDHMLPYLSKFLGHKSFDETFYYYHYTKKAAQNIHKKDSTVDKVIPEVMRR